MPAKCQGWCWEQRLRTVYCKSSDIGQAGSLIDHVFATTSQMMMMQTFGSVSYKLPIADHRRCCSDPLLAAVAHIPIRYTRIDDFTLVFVADRKLRFFAMLVNSSLLQRQIIIDVHVTTASSLISFCNQAVHIESANIKHSNLGRVWHVWVTSFDDL